MKRLILLALALAVLCTIGCAQSSSPSVLVIHDVTVIDATGAPAQAHRTVIVRDGKMATLLTRWRRPHAQSPTYSSRAGKKFGRQSSRDFSSMLLSLRVSDRISSNQRCATTRNLVGSDRVGR